MMKFSHKFDPVSKCTCQGKAGNCLEGASGYFDGASTVLKDNTFSEGAVDVGISIKLDDSVLEGASFEFHGNSFCDISQSLFPEGKNGSESFFEKLNRFSDGFCQIEQCWQKALATNDRDFAGKIEADSRLPMFFIMKRNMANDHGSISGKIIIGEMYFSDTRPADGEAPGREILSGFNDDVVLIHVAQFGDDPNQTIRSTVAMRFYLVEDKVCSLWDGLLYRTLSDGLYQILPRFADWKILTPSFFARGSYRQAFPNLIEGTAKVEANFADCCGNIAGIDGVTKRGGTVMSLPEAREGGAGNLIDFGLEIVEALEGPFNLDFGAMNSLFKGSLFELSMRM